VRKVVAALGAVAVVGVAAAVAAAVTAPAVRRQKRTMEAIDPDLRVREAYLPLTLNSVTTPLQRRAPLGPAPDLTGVELRVLNLPPDDGLDGVAVRVYTPADREVPAPAVLYVHGGGYVVGTAESDDGKCAEMARSLGAVVVSVDYRLAPEHPFPAAHEDCLRALSWVHAAHDSLGIDPARVAVSGESAGGGLAAGLVQRAVDEGIPVCFQHLVYPMLDDRTVPRAEADGSWHAIWTPSSNRFGWTSYLGREPGGDEPRPYAVPARRDSLAGMPPTWIGVGEVDLFHDESVEYAERLRADGVECELLVVPGMYHAAQRFAPDVPSMVEFERSGAAALARGLGVAIPA
jgi:acetyl esterase/lipase